MAKLTGVFFLGAVRRLLLGQIALGLVSSALFFFFEGRQAGVAALWGFWLPALGHYFFARNAFGFERLEPEGVIKRVYLAEVKKIIVLVIGMVIGIRLVPEKFLVMILNIMLSQVVNILASVRLRSHALGGV